MKSLPDNNSTSVAGYKLNKCKLLKGKHPLKQFTFYLDINNTNVSKKIEQLIKELGGVLVFFWNNNVTHIVTDKLNENAINKISSDKISSKRDIGNSINLSVSSTKSPGPTNDIRATQKSKSRADAMLSRARQTVYDSTQGNIISLATELGTSVWHTNYTHRFLKKVLADNCNTTQKVHSNPSVASPFDHKSHYIKIEATHAGYRPFYHVLKQATWPSFRLQKKKTAIILDCKKKEKTNVTQQSNVYKVDMTRKSRSSKHISIKRSSKPNSSDKQCGFCEICKVEYDVLKIHLETEEHGCFVKNESNFIVLDSLINSRANVNKFLDINTTTKIKTDTHYLATDCKTILQRQTRQTASRHCSSASYNGERIDSSTSKHLVGNVDDLDNTRNMKLYETKIETDKFDKGTVNTASPPIRRGIPPSLIYEVIQTKQPTGTKPDAKSRETFSDNNEESKKQSIIVKLKKIRQTELSLLSDEAENFMYPKKFTSEPTDVDRQTTSENSRLSSSSIMSNEILTKLDATMDDAASKQHSKRRKINDRPSPKIRNGQVAMDDTNLDESQCYQKADLKEIKVVTKSLSTQFYNSNFAFERIPFHEPWFDVFHRQDDVKEQYFEYYGHTEYRKLPYEMGPVAPTEKQNCLLCPKIHSKFINATTERCQDSLQNQPLRVCSNDRPRTETLLKKAFINFDVPRKSPREHASTLAILSCLIQQNERSKSTDSTNIKLSPKETELICASDEDESRKIKSTKTHPATTVTNNDSSKLTSQTLFPHTKEYYTGYVSPMRKQREIESFLLQSNTHGTLCSNSEDIFHCEESDYLSSLSNQCSLTDIVDDDVLVSLNKYNNGGHKHLNKNRYLNVFAVNKKRRNNKTGWPIKRRIPSNQRRCNMNANISKLAETNSISSPSREICEELVSTSPYYNNTTLYNESVNTVEYSNNLDISENFTVSSDSLDTLDMDSKDKLSGPSDVHSNTAPINTYIDSSNTMPKRSCVPALTENNRKKTLNKTTNLSMRKLRKSRASRIHRR